jgi:hypothetical protein
MEFVATGLLDFVFPSAEAARPQYTAKNRQKRRVIFYAPFFCRREGRFLNRLDDD